MRAAVSTGPPAANGTTSVTGRVGHSCAWAAVTDSHSSTANQPAQAATSSCQAWRFLWWPAYLAHSEYDNDTVALLATESPVTMSHVVMKFLAAAPRHNSHDRRPVARDGLRLLQLRRTTQLLREEDRHPARAVQLSRPGQACARRAGRSPDPGYGGPGRGLHGDGGASQGPHRVLVPRYERPRRHAVDRPAAVDRDLRSRSARYRGPRPGTEPLQGVDDHQHHGRRRHLSPQQRTEPADHAGAARTRQFLHRLQQLHALDASGGPGAGRRPTPSMASSDPAGSSRSTRTAASGTSGRYRAGSPAPPRHRYRQRP